MSKAIRKPTPTESQSKAIISLMPGNLLSKHQNLAQMQDEAYWGSGELSLKLQEMYYPEYSKAAIRKVVGQIYSIAGNTVRDRERVAASVDIALRNALPFLKFSHWRNIIPAGQDKANQIIWESVALFEAEKKGPSVDQIISWRENESIDATPPWIYRLQDGLEKLEMVRDDPRADPQIRLWFEQLIEKVEARAAVLKLERFQRNNLPELTNNGNENENKISPNQD